MRPVRESPTIRALPNERMKRSFFYFLAGAGASMLCLAGFNACATPPDHDHLKADIRAEVSAPPVEKGASCDSAGFLDAAALAEKLRVKRRISAETFARMAKEPGTIVLDARGALDHAQLRVKGSINLPYTAMAEESLRRVIPNPETRILIYCRNNLVSSRPSTSFPVVPTPPKIMRDPQTGLPYPTEFDPPQIPKTYGAGLNIPTYITLYIYGYRNVYELDPVVDPNNSPIEFVSGR